MVSLAPLWYRNVVHSDQGPIVRLAVHERETKGPYTALAYLHPLLRGVAKANAIYGKADGTGTAATRAIASHVAISEALETWAFYASLANRDARAAMGLDVDPTSTGFAAWPGPFSRQARIRALHEAIERWSLLAWWGRRLGHEALENSPDRVVRTHKIVTPWPAVSMVLVDRAVDPGLRAYGFACDATETEAIRRASVELARNVAVLEKWAALVDKPEPGLLMERRLIYFAGPRGYAEFLTRLAQNVQDPVDSHPNLLVDRSVPGPWERYCRVWRCLFEPAIEPSTALDRFLF